MVKIKGLIKPHEKKKNDTESRLNEHIRRQMIKSYTAELIEDLNDNDAVDALLENSILYPKYDVGDTVKAGEYFVFSEDGRVYLCHQNFTINVAHKPNAAGMIAVFTPIAKKDEETGYQSVIVGSIVQPNEIVEYNGKYYRFILDSQTTIAAENWLPPLASLWQEVKI